MNEKQRFLLKDVEAWRKRQFDRIGNYGPHVKPSTPPNVRAAHRAKRQAERTIAQWEKASRAPWESAAATIRRKVEEVRRVVVFGKTDAALKAVRALPERPTR